MNIALTEGQVIAHCGTAGVPISAIEALPGGGTHLVTVTGEGAALMRRVLAKHLMEGRVRRFAFMHSRHTPLSF